MTSTMGACRLFGYTSLNIAYYNQCFFDNVHIAIHIYITIIFEPITFLFLAIPFLSRLSPPLLW